MTAVNEKLPMAIAQFVDKPHESTLCCPQCGGGTRVIDSRAGPENSVRRRRACCNSKCLARMTTYEWVRNDAPMVDLGQLEEKISSTIEGAKVLLDQARSILAAAARISKFDR